MQDEPLLWVLNALDLYGHTIEHHDAAGVVVTGFNDKRMA